MKRHTAQFLPLLSLGLLGAGCTISSGDGDSPNPIDNNSLPGVSAIAESTCVPSCTLFVDDVAITYNRAQDYQSDGLSLNEAIDALVTFVESRPVDSGGGADRAQVCLPCFSTVAGEVYADDGSSPSPPPNGPSPSPTPPTATPTPPPASPPPQGGGFMLEAPADQIVTSGTWVSLFAAVSGESSESLTYAWKQISGPTVEFQSADGPSVQFLAPQIATPEEVVRLELKVSDDEQSLTDLVDVSILPATVLPYAIECGHSSTLEVESSSLIHVNTLAKNFTEFAIELTSSDDANVSSALAPLSFYLSSLGGVNEDVTDLFSYDSAARRVTLNPSQVEEFRSLLDDDLIELLIGGYDDQDRGIGMIVSFYYGSNTIEGRVVDASGGVATGLAGESVTAFSFSTGANRTTQVESNGSFRFDDLPTDVYEITLTSADGSFASDVAPILSGGTTVTFDLALDPVEAKISGNSSSVNRKIASPVKQYGDNGSLHRRAALPAPRIDLASRRGKAPQRLFPSDNRMAMTGTDVSAASGAENQKIEMVVTATVPQGQQAVTMRYRVDSAEYPTYTGDASKFDDKFGFQFTVKDQSTVIDQWRGNGSVNALHAALAPDGVTDWQSKSVDVENFTKDGPISVTMRAWAINVGDSAFATTIMLDVNTPPLVITEFRHLTGLMKGRRSGKTYLGIPRTKDTHTPWKALVEFRPESAKPLFLSIGLKSSGNTLMFDEYSDDFLLGMLEGEGRLMTSFEIPDGVGMSHTLAEKASLSVVLKAMVNGEVVTSTESLMRTATGTELTPLYDVGEDPTDSRRYSGRDQDLGGDAWARKRLRDWLLANPDIIFNDCSLEHGGPWPIRSNGKRDHSSHQDGVDVDVRYFGDDPALDSNASGARQQLTSQARAEYGNPPVAGTKQHRLVEWIKKNRTRMDQIAADSNVRLLYIEKKNWSRKALVDGQYEDGFDILATDGDGRVGPLGKWTGKSEKIKPWPGHDNHVHINFFK